MNETYVGVVDGCERLYVRVAPNQSADPVSVIDKGTRVTIDDSFSNSDFYKVTIDRNERSKLWRPNGQSLIDGEVHGYCKKEFIKMF